MSRGGFGDALDAGAVKLEFPGGGHNYSLHRLADSPCHAACPAGVDVKGYIGLIAQGRMQEAVDLVRERCPLPGICGRVCTHPCELACQRSEQDEAVAIRLLKRFVSDWEDEHPSVPPRPAPRHHEERVAVVGGGPAGLAAAFDLVREGYGVTLFEMADEPGGMLNQCIPSFRLPRRVIHKEVNHIAQLGVEFRTGVTFGRDLSLDDLHDEGFGAVLLAVGAQLGKRLGVDGERENLGVFDCVQFLRMIERKLPLPSGKSLLVVGGGMSAMDAARTGKRLGLKVTVVYRRTRSEMPAVIDEVQDAEREGVKFRFLAAPTEVLGKGGRVKGLRCQAMKLVAADESGRPRPVPIRGEFFDLKADLIVTAISQEADFSLLPKGDGFERSKWGTLVADEDTLATGVEGVFAAGDLVLGPDTVIGAIAQGHRAAESIHAYLRGRPLLGPSPPRPMELGILPRSPRKRLRRQQQVLPVEERKGFREVELGYHEDAAREEALRCLRCGPCQECGSCADECRHRIALLRPAGETNGHPMGPTLVRVPNDPEEFPLALEPRPVSLTWPGQGLAAGGDHRSEWELSPLLCKVDERLCRACGDCVTACPYDAIRIMEGTGGGSAARVFPEFCKSCGSCASVCPTGAMIADHYGHQGMIDEISALLAPDPPLGASRILLLSCNWCFPLAASRLDEMPPSLRIMDTLCTGRIHPAFILSAFEAGADGVFVTGCAEGECHYRTGNQTFLGHVARLQGILGLLGVDSERFDMRLFHRGEIHVLPEILGDFIEGVRGRGRLDLDPAPAEQEVSS